MKLDTMAEWLRRGPAIKFWENLAQKLHQHPARTLCVREFDSRWCRKLKTSFLAQLARLEDWRLHQAIRDQELECPSFYIPLII